MKEHTTPQENERSPFEQIVLDEMREIREAQYHHAVNRLERFEQRASGTLHTYNETEKQTVSFSESGEIFVQHEPIDPEEKRLLDEALEITEAYERDYEKEPWDSFDPPSYEELEAQETIYLIERAREIINQEEEYNKQTQGGSGLSDDQKIALRDMGAIRDKQEEPSRSRLADFKEQDLSELKEPDDLREFEDRDAVEARIARDPDFWGEDMRPLNDDDMDMMYDDDGFLADEFDLER